MLSVDWPVHKQQEHLYYYLNDVNVPWGTCLWVKHTENRHTEQAVWLERRKEKLLVKLNSEMPEPLGGL